MSKTKIDAEGRAIYSKDGEYIPKSQRKAVKAVSSKRNQKKEAKTEK